MSSSEHSVIERVFEKVRRDSYANTLGIEVLEIRGLREGLSHGRRGHAGLPRRSSRRIDSFSSRRGLCRGQQLAQQEGRGAGPEHKLSRPVKAGETLVAEAFEESLGERTAFYRIVVKSSRGELVACCQGLVYRTEEAVV